MTLPRPICAICGQSIALNARWEYWHVGINDVGKLVHALCKTALVQQVLQDINHQSAPTDRRNEQSK